MVSCNGYLAKSRTHQSGLHRQHTVPPSNHTNQAAMQVLASLITSLKSRVWLCLCACACIWLFVSTCFLFFCICIIVNKRVDIEYFKTYLSACACWNRIQLIHDPEQEKEVIENGSPPWVYECIYKSKRHFVLQYLNGVLPNCPHPLPPQKICPNWQLVCCLQLRLCFCCHPLHPPLALQWSWWAFWPWKRLSWIKYQEWSVQWTQPGRHSLLNL